MGLRKENFSDNGNFGFGVQEHIDLGIKYDPSIGIYGMDFYVVLGRPGMNVLHRRKKTGKVGTPHKQEAVKHTTSGDTRSSPCTSLSLAPRRPDKSAQHRHLCCLRGGGHGDSSS